MKNNKLRTIWIIPNVFCYLMFFGIIIFITMHADGLQDINMFGLWLFYALALLLVSVFGSFRIYTWIKRGKM